MKIIKRAIYLLQSAWLLRKIKRSKQASTRTAAQQRLTELLASQRGIGMKIGQALAGMNDQSDLSQLTQSVQAWPLSEIRPVLEEQWQQPIASILNKLDESIAAASLGQVHRAELCAEHKNSFMSSDVAIKVQYPDIRQAIQSELSLAGMMPKAGPMKRWDFDLKSYQDTLSSTLLDELDYLHEMKQQQHFKRVMQVAGLLVPRVYPTLCTSHVLVQEWVEGKRLAEAAAWPYETREKLAQSLMQTLWQSLFEHGLVHGDPHPGNLLFQYDAQQPVFVLLDYGCMIPIPQHRCMALLHLIQALRGKVQLNSFDAFVGLGFNANKLQPIKAQLDDLARILFQPFLHDELFDTQTWQISSQVNHLLGDMRWYFRSAAPADLFLMVRIFQGLVTQLECLNVKLSWVQALEQAVSRKTLRSSLSWQLDQSRQPKLPVIKGSATTLRVKITKPNQGPMEISLVASSALELHELLPPHILPHIAQLNIDVAAIENQLYEHGLEPQNLLDFSFDDKHYLVWLE